MKDKDIWSAWIFRPLIIGTHASFSALFPRKFPDCLLSMVNTLRLGQAGRDLIVLRLVNTIKR